VRDLAEQILGIQRRIRDQVVAAGETQAVEALAAVAHDDADGDTIFAVDLIGEEILVEAFAELAAERPLVLVGEGLPGGRLALGDGDRMPVVVVVDPIDSTRGLMYQKRSAWILTGVASADYEAPTLEVALHGQGVEARRRDRIGGGETALRLRPSRAATIEQGFATVARFFPGARDALAAIDAEIVTRAIGPAPAGKANCFEDQYISAGGQLYELASGHDRFVADLRPLLAPVPAKRGLPPAIAAHPYDLCTALVAREAGAIVVAPDGGRYGFRSLPTGTSPGLGMPTTSVVVSSRCSREP
jgi:hypothetical protein